MLNPRLDLLTDYPFQRLRDLLDPLPPKAGQEPLMMSIGEPKHTPPAFIQEILQEKAALWGNYPPPSGTPELRAAIQAWLTRRFDLPEGMIDRDAHILPTAGSREALYMAGAISCSEDKANAQPLVLTPNPFYQVYVGAGTMAGALSLPIHATEKTGFLPDYAALDPDMLDLASLVYLCSPANPQGAVASLETYKTLITLARKHDFILASDECYSEIYFTDHPPAGALQACAAMGGDMSNVLVFNSLSKRSSAPGLRSGFIAGDPNIIKAFARLRSYGGAPIPGPICAASAALWEDEAHVKESLELYEAKMDLAERKLDGAFGFTRPDGSFFLWLDVGDGEKAAQALWTQAGVRVLPGAYLGREDAEGRNPGNRFIRLALVHDEPVLEPALEAIKSVLGG